MVMRYGMHEKLGHVAYETERPVFLQVPGAMPATREYSEDTAHEIDRAVRDIAQAAFDRAVGILKERRETLERGARELLAHETLGEEDLNRLRPPSTGAKAAPARSGGH
jgi:cell division protease FtsH